MKRVMTTALVLSLLGSTSIAAEAPWTTAAREREGRQAQAQAQPQQQAPQGGERAGRGDGGGRQQQAQPQQVAQAPQAGEGRGGRGGRGDGGGRQQAQPQQPQPQQPQPQQQGPGRAGGRGDGGGRQQGAPQQAQPQQQGGPRGAYGPGRQQYQPSPQVQQQAPGRAPWAGRGDGGRQQQEPSRGRGDWDRNDGGRQGPGSWDSRGQQGWRNDDRRDRDRNRPVYDQRRFPREFRPAQRYRGPVYRPPVGFYIRTWRFNDFLPFGWYNSNYWIDDWWSFGLPMPPIGFEWVRVGRDVLLVDMYTGRVVQVVYGLFW